MEVRGKAQLPPPPTHTPTHIVYSPLPPRSWTPPPPTPPTSTVHFPLLIASPSPRTYPPDSPPPPFPHPYCTVLPPTHLHCPVALRQRLPARELVLRLAHMPADQAGELAAGTATAQRHGGYEQVLAVRVCPAPHTRSYTRPLQACHFNILFISQNGWPTKYCEDIMIEYTRELLCCDVLALGLGLGLLYSR